MVLAKTYGALSLYTNALEMGREALRLRKLTFGETNLVVADAQALLGEIMYEQRDLQGAENFARQGLQMRMTLLGRPALGGGEQTPRGAGDQNQPVGKRKSRCGQIL